MFYLKEFSKLFKNHLMLSIILAVAIMGLVTSVHQREFIKSELSLNQKTHNMPYFNALVSDKINLDSIRRKMKMLPGVFAVSVVENKDLNKELGHLKNNFGSDIISELSSLNYKRLKIQLEEGVHLKNQQLVKEYLSRLVGKKDLTIGSIKNPRQLKIKQDDSLMQLLNYIDIYLVGFFMVLLTITIMLLLKPVNNQAYIIEKFQRKNKVNVKIMLSGLVAITAISFVFNYLAKPEFETSSFAIISFILILPIIIVMSKKSHYKV